MSKNENISDILARNLKRHGLDRAALGAWVCGCANKVGEGEFESVSFRDGALKIRVFSSAGAALLKMKEGDLIFKINRELKRDLVKKLRFEIV